MRPFLSCFEYRTDGDTRQKTDDINSLNGDITDGLYPYSCLSNTESTETIEANEYVEVRMVGAHLWFGDINERFDWTRFDVIPPAMEYNLKGKCKGGQWSLDVTANGGYIGTFFCEGGEENEINETIMLPLSEGVVVLSAEGPGSRECSSSFTYEQDLDKVKLECKDGSKHDRVEAKFEIKRHGHDHRPGHDD
jgi:hypothetical protein